MRRYAVGQRKGNGKGGSIVHSHLKVGSAVFPEEHMWEWGLIGQFWWNPAVLPVPCPFSSLNDQDSICGPSCIVPCLGGGTRRTCHFGTSAVNFLATLHPPLRISMPRLLDHLLPLLSLICSPSCQLGFLPPTSWHLQPSKMMPPKVLQTSFQRNQAEREGSRVLQPGSMSC